MARKKRTPEENARREKIRELLRMANIGSMEDIQILKQAARGKVDVTVGSALDLFGGSMKWEDVLDICQKSENYFEK